MFLLRPAFRVAKSSTTVPTPKSMSASGGSLEAHDEDFEKDPIVVGHSPSNFWTFDPTTGWDLTHGPPSPGRTMRPITLKTTTAPITVDPYNSALIIIDMQNLFLSSALGHKESDAHKAEAKLLETGIPAARKAGIQIMYLNWGITDNDLPDLPPALIRVFNFTSNTTDNTTDALGKEKKAAIGIGEPIGDVALPDGSVIDAGRLLMRGEWNTKLHAPLKADYDMLRMISPTKPPDILTYKTRMSGLWSDFDSPCLENLQRKGMRTLFFAGVNNDQCILANIQDAVNHEFDAVLLEDGCGTTSSDSGWEAVELEGRKGWGFVSSCDALAEGVDAAGYSST